MNPRQRKLQVEELERRELPSANLAILAIQPPSAAAPQAVKVANVGCEKGIDAHANQASNGVVACDLV